MLQSSNATDGAVFSTVTGLPRTLSRVKTLSRLDIAEKRRPQDGRIKVDRNGKEAEIRVSTVPVAFGEKAVLRILDPEILFQDIASIGFSKRDSKVYQSLASSPHGIILVTGPTGSGKSTTLYSTLKEIATSENPTLAGLMLIFYSLGIWSVWYIQRSDADAEAVAMLGDIDLDGMDIGDA